jgi:hypothetical protein
MMTILLLRKGCNVSYGNKDKRKRITLILINLRIRSTRALGCPAQSTAFSIHRNSSLAWLNNLFSDRAIDRNLINFRPIFCISQHLINSYAPHNTFRSVLQYLCSKTRIAPYNLSVPSILLVEDIVQEQPVKVTDTNRKIVNDREC